MNVYLHDATNTTYYFPGLYRGQLLEKIWDFTKPYKVFDIIDDEYQENSIFIVSHDWFITEFYRHDNSIDLKEKIRKIKNKKILLDFSSKTLLASDTKSMIDVYKNFLEEREFTPENIYWIVQTKKDVETLKNYLEIDVNVFYRDAWLNEVFQFIITKIFQNKKNYLTITNNLPKKKFSLFLRRFENIRFHVICELLAKDLLDDFYYTFCAENKNGDTKNDVDEKIINHIKNLPEYFTNHKQKIENWVKNIPYIYNEFIPNRYDDFYNMNLGPYYNSSDIHLVVESHVESKSNTADWSSLTEKTYKAMLYKKPLIIFSQPYNLQYLRDCGYKTYSPYIDESYDNIIDTQERLRAIVIEVERIRNLPADKYQQLFLDCQNIVEHNYNLLLENANKPIPDNFLLKNMSFL